MGIKKTWLFSFIMVLMVSAISFAFLSSPTHSLEKDKDPESPFEIKDQESPSEEQPSHTLKRGFFIQLGSFKDKENALNLQKSVESWGYATELNSLKKKDSELTIVVVGPFIERESAEKHKKIIEGRASLSKTVIKEKIE